MKNARNETASKETAPKETVSNQVIFSEIKALILNKDFFRKFVNAVPSGFLMLNKNGAILETNAAYCRMSGYSRDELLQMNLRDLKSFDEISTVDYCLQTAIEKKSLHFETRHLSKDGKVIELAADAVYIQDGGDFVCTFQHDITQRKAGELALRESEKFLTAITEAAPSMIYIYDFTIGRNIYVNRQIERNLGYTPAEIQAMGAGFLFKIAHPDDTEPLIQHFEKLQKSKPGETAEIEYRLKHKSGEYRWFRSSDSIFRSDENGKPFQTLGYADDITERRASADALAQSESQLRQSQKNEAIGRLAGGIAHDFNNFLAIVMLHVDMLNLQMPSDSPIRYRISEIKSATNSAAAMVRQLLAFSRKQTLQPCSLNLNQIITELNKILRRLIGEDIELQCELDPNLGECFVDPDQMTQVLMNLVVNARDAMPKGGVLKIQTTNFSLSKRAAKYQSQPVGDYIELTVTDSGTGMDSETQERIFEPFFTTKESGKGTGLGLATVYGIVKQSNGFIWVESESGIGTTLIIQLPHAEKSIAKKPEETSSYIPTGHETILLVEDEEQIRRAAVEVLNILGYQIFEASDGLQALQLAQLYDKPIHLLLTDVVMPRMNGRDLAEKIKVLHPETTVLFMSGYTDDIIARHGVLEKETHFIGKPFSPSTLAVKIRETLEAKTRV